MTTPEQDRLQENVRRSAGLHALKKTGAIADAEQKREAARTRFLYAFLSYGWIVLLLAIFLLAHFLGAF
jgi:hypothetical protein